MFEQTTPQSDCCWESARVASSPPVWQNREAECEDGQKVILSVFFNFFFLSLKSWTDESAPTFRILGRSHAPTLPPNEQQCACFQTCCSTLNFFYFYFYFWVRQLLTGHCARQDRSLLEKPLKPFQAVMWPVWSRHRKPTCTQKAPTFVVPHFQRCFFQ